MSDLTKQSTAFQQQRFLSLAAHHIYEYMLWPYLLVGSQTRQAGQNNILGDVLGV
jgi:hypothetical protein